MGMRVYVAAPWTHKETAKVTALKLTLAGHTITHDWWNHEAGAEDYAELGRLAKLDIAGVNSADYLILLNLEKSEGKAVEQGIAISEGIPILAIGAHPSNIFQNLPTYYTWFKDVEEIIERLRN